MINKNSLCCGEQVISQRNVAKFLKQAGHRDINCFGKLKSWLKRLICDESQQVTVLLVPLYKCGHNSLSSSNDSGFWRGLASPVYLQLYLWSLTLSDCPHSPYQIQLESTLLYN